MAKKDQHLTRCYAKYNKKWFDGKLPNCEVLWNEELKKCYGISLAFEEEDVPDSQFYQIHINPDLHYSFEQAKFTLLHEMVHLQLFPYQRHGKKFNDAMKALAIKGAFDELW